MYAVIFILQYASTIIKDAINLKEEGCSTEEIQVILEALDVQRSKFS